MEALLQQIELTKVPRHVAVIMDGNGRWAARRGLLRLSGHKAGTKAVKEVIEGCRDLSIEYLTIYAFSSENWNRPKKEVDALMGLFVQSMRKELKNLMKEDIRFNVIGELTNLPEKVREELSEGVERTKHNRRAVLTVALNYGAQDEWIQSVKEIARRVKNDEINIADIDKALVEDTLYTRGLPPVDLLIRTSGEQRISNFLLWQIAYAELYFTEVLWPDFKRKNLYEAVLNYQNRERRFGLTSEQLT